jgi:small-conductance mechanosensitive channel
MLMEDQYGVGDVVDAGPAAGTVEGVGAAHHPAARRRQYPVAHPQRRDPPGRQPLPGLGPGAVDVEVAYSTDLDAVTRVIERVAHELYVDERWASKLLDQPEVWGVEELGPDSIRVRLVAKTRPLAQWKVARELRARLKVAFDQAGIEVSAQKALTTSGGEGQNQDQPAA